MDEVWRLVADVGKTVDHVMDNFRKNRVYHGERCAWCQYSGRTPQAITMGEGQGHPDPASLHQADYGRIAVLDLKTPYWVKTMSDHLFYSNAPAPSSATRVVLFTDKHDHVGVPRGSLVYQIVPKAPHLGRRWSLNSNGFPTFEDTGAAVVEYTVVSLVTDDIDTVRDAMKAHHYRLPMQKCLPFADIYTTRDVNQLNEVFFGVVTSV